MNMEHSRPDDHVGNGSDCEAAPLNDLDRGFNAERQSIPSQISLSPPKSRSSSTFAKDQHNQSKDNTLYTHKAPPSLTPRPEEVRHHGAVLLLFLVYAFIAILSWTFTCLLCNHPIGASTWDDQYGNLSISHYQDSDRLRRASSVGLTAISAIGIPVTSAIAARAAASYCQPNSSGETRAVTMRQMLALADKGWSGYESIREMLRPHTSRAVRTPLLVFATSLITTAFLLPILQAIFVSTKQVRVYTLEDSRYPKRSQLGPFVTPTDMMDQNFNRTISNVISDTINGKLSDSQPNLWTSGSGAVNLTSLAAALETAPNSSGYQALPLKYFSSALPVGSNTGVLRNLATRMNTSIDCQLIPQTHFPATCSSENAFYREFSNIVNDSDPNPFHSGTLYSGHPRYRGRICAPGKKHESPWKNTADRQDIHEDLWIDFQFSNLENPKIFGGYDVGMAERANFTQHCMSNSTLGFYEVPNYWNGNTVGSLLTRVPSPSHNRTYDNTRLTGEDFSNDGGYKVPGPLMTSTLAIFGQNTFFDVVAEPKTNEVLQYDSLSQALCSQLRYPFSGLVPSISINREGYRLRPFSDWDIPTYWQPCFSKNEGSSKLLIGLMSFMPQLASPINTIAALTLTAYSMHKHIFTVSMGSFTYIFQAYGTTHQRPEMSTTAMIIITLLLAFQLCGLGFLAIYTYIRPSWTETLDAKAILKIGAEIAQMKNVRDHIPGGIGLATSHKEMAPLLDQTEGWVGRANRDDDTEGMRNDDADNKVINGVREKKAHKELVLGGRRPVRLRKKDLLLSHQ